MALPNDCPLCGAGSDQIFVKTAHVYGDQLGKSAFFGCESCEVFFQFPGLTADQQNEFYANEFEDFMSSRAGSAGGWDSVELHQHANESTVKRRLKYLHKFITDKPLNILEIGCSSGFMLREFEALGHHCYGIEPSGLFCSALKQLGLRVSESLDDLLVEYSVPKFDLVVHFFVLEHIQDPKDFLESQLGLIHDDGMIIFEIPNSSDPLATVFDIPEFERFYWSVAHPWYFNERSCKFLLEQLPCNYEILLDQRYDLSNHFSWALDRRPGGSGRFSAKLGDDLDEMYRALLVKRGRCDTLVAIVTR